MFNRQEKTISEIEAENYEKYKDCDKKSRKYFSKVVVKERVFINETQQTVELSYLEDGERVYKKFYDTKSCTEFFNAMYDEYLNNIKTQEKENAIKSSLIHIKHATQDDYLDIQSKLMEQGNKIIGVDVIYSLPPNSYVYVIKYQQPINSEIEQ